jgi:cell division protein FtsN
MQSPFDWVKKAVVAVAFVSFGAIIWYVTSNRDTLETENLNPPLVQAPISIKERATEPGGMDIPNQDKEIFNLLDRMDTEQRIDMASTVEASRNRAPTADTLTEVAPQRAAQAAQQPAVPQAPAQQQQTAVQPAPVAPVVQPTAPATSPLPAKVESFTNKIVADRQQQAAISAPKEASKGEWAVQLASYTAEDAALRGIKIFQDKYPDLLGRLTPMVKRVQLDKGTYHRVFFTGIATKAESDALCAKLKQQNQACLNVKQ